MSGAFGSSQWAYSSGVAGYQIEDSLRFEDGSSAYLNRTPASAGNRKTWTWSGWVKRGNLGTTVSLMDALQNTGVDWTRFHFNTSNQLSFAIEISNSNIFQFITTQVFRDPSAWYHIVAAYDSTQATSTDRFKLYVNGEQITDFSTEIYGAQNTDSHINSTIEHNIGAVNNGIWFFDGYMSDIYFIDGQALDASSFGETIDGYWRPVAYSGTYGTNGFHLEFDGAVTDSSGNGNDWTANNISAHDYVPDSPSNNWSVINSQVTRGNVTEKTVFSEGNLKVQGQTSGTALQIAQSTMQFPATGKYYFEVLIVSSDSASAWHIGIVSNYSNSGIVSDSEVYYREDGQKRIDGTNSAYGATYTAGDIIGVSVNLDDDEVEFFKNNSSQGVISHTLSGDFIPMLFVPPTADQAVANFGQDSTFAGNTTAGGNTDANGIGDFKYPVPSGGYLSLCAANLPEPTIVDGSEYFNTVLYTGTGATQSITGVGFQPDFVWAKRRSAAGDHILSDSVRTAGKYLSSNLTADEITSTDFDSFDSDGFTVNAVDQTGGLNASGSTYAAWNWKAGTSFSNSAGTNGATIASSGSVNTDAGFSIVSYVGTGSAGTVYHGLSSSAPEVIFVKNRDVARSWLVYHAYNTSAPETDFLILNQNVDTDDSTLPWNDTAPTSSVFSVGTSLSSNESTKNFIAYCFHSSDVCKVGSYTGNSQLDERSPYIHTGFRPAWIMIKKSSAGTTGSWVVFDSVRSTHNPADVYFYANESDDEYSGSREIDFLSNGFKIRNAAVNLNNSNNFVFLAFAETPFKFSTAR